MKVEIVRAWVVYLNENRESVHALVQLSSYQRIVLVKIIIIIIINKLVCCIGQKKEEELKEERLRFVQTNSCTLAREGMVLGV